MRDIDAVLQTRKAAQRLLKSVLRAHLFLSTADLQPMLLAERSLAQAAEREWAGVMGYWDLDDKADVERLAAIVRDVFPTSAHEVASIFDHPWETRGLLETYWSTFDAVAFVRGKRS